MTTTKSKKSFWEFTYKQTPKIVAYAVIGLFALGIIKHSLDKKKYPEYYKQKTEIDSKYNAQRNSINWNYTLRIDSTKQAQNLELKKLEEEKEKKLNSLEKKFKN